MMTSTEGLQLHTKRRWLADAVELISSMRFAISLLVLVAIAAVAGTILKQNEPLPNYVNQFGPFWFDVFDKLGLYAVYSTWWFLLIMGFLMLSTSLCIIRNAPKMLKDMRSWRDNVREQSLHNFHHRHEWVVNVSPAELMSRLVERVAAHGYGVRVFEKENGALLAARRGAASKWGYIFAHSAIVIICIGGLLDSDMPIRFQEWFYGKTPIIGNNIASPIPDKYRLDVANPTFRGNTLIPEGGSSNTVIIPRRDGILIQDLPFTIQLRRFVIDYYSTGMPKLFESDVTVVDRDGKSFPAVIKVNQPLIHDGVAVYQSSFEDGGSKLMLTGYPMAGAQEDSFVINGEVGGSTPLANAKYGDYTVEWSGFRGINVENMAQDGQDARAVNIGKGESDRLFADLGKHLGSAAKDSRGKNLHNVGPSVQYKLRDKTGQAREYSNYMLPVQLDGASVFLAGMRESPDEPFRYLRIPADDEGSVTEWMRIRAALRDPQLRERAAQRYAERALPNASSDKLRPQLAQSTLKGLTIFAGDEKDAGYLAVSHFLEKLPSDAQEKAADVFMKILSGGMWDLWQVAREKDGLPAVPADETHARFLQLAENAYSDAFFYGAPVYLQLKDFNEIKASVLQVTRSPGKKIVYLGCLLLVIGVFSMLYVRERRLWIWLKPDADGATRALMAMSSQRKTLDFEKEFDTLKERLPQQ